MNTLPPPTDETTASATTLPQHQVGIHFALPLVPRLVILAAVASPVCVLYFARSLDVLLRREGILCGGGVGGHGDMSEGLAMLTTSDLGRALVAVQELLEAWALINEFVEVAWFDPAEGIWRQHPAEASRPFERWLTPEQYDLRTALSQSVLTSPLDDSHP